MTADEKGVEVDRSWADRKDDLTPAQVDLVEMLMMFRDLRRRIARPPGVVYTGMQDFLLRFGVWYQPTPWTEAYPEGTVRACFNNAITLAATSGLRYVEGVALAEDIPLEVHHGWNATEVGGLVDSTWKNRGRAYLGVEFSLGRASHASCVDRAAVLDNPGNRFQIYREPWTGEDFARRWPSNIALRMARQRQTRSRSRAKSVTS